MQRYQKRVQTVQRDLEKRGLAGVLLSYSPNLYYLTGFHELPGERLLLGVILRQGDPFFFAPQLYGSQLKQESWVQEIHLWSDDENPFHSFERVMREKGLAKGTYAIDDTFWAGQLLSLMERLPQVKFAPLQGLLSSLRLLKSTEEVNKIRASSHLADEIVTLVKKKVRPGMSEMEIAAFIEHAMKEKGASGRSFATIVGSGPNSALPHHNTGDRKIQTGEFLLLDFGALYQSYCSDISRTLAIGQPSEKMRQVYQVVQEAQDLGVRSVKPGMLAREVDEQVRQYITKAGFGEFFTHRTGHGLGLEVHEEPYISKIGETVLEPGMVFSIEPGIYLEGEFGVRIEDIVVVTETGCERLNQASHKLQIIE